MKLCSLVFYSVYLLASLLADVFAESATAEL
jgi:hypothetical protein